MLVTNFPDHVTARDLWKVCNNYGVVVDAFIRYKKSKAGKRFAFVRFIKVDNIDRLVTNLCTIWIRHFHLYANVHRFHKERKSSAHSHPSNADERNSPGSVYWVRAKEMILMKDKVLSEDPFNLYDILNKRKDSGDELKYPPGFTPSVTNVEEANKKVKWATSNKVNEHVNSTSNKLEESVPKGKLSSNNSVCSKRVHTGGSILQLMDELVKVGQTMGYNMEWCMRNIKVIIGSQGECNVETKMESMELVTIKTLWGNSSFDYALSSSLGNSGGILCVWEPTLFVKDNVTSSDNFLVVMVRTEQERYGSVFNVQDANAINSSISLASLIDLPLEGYAYTWAHKTANKMKGDENTKFFHGILNSKRSQLAIRGTLVDDEWIVDSLAVKSVFLKYFSTQFSSPVSLRICFADQFTNRLSSEQQADLERNASNEEIKSVVWDCGTNKSHGPDGFTFEFFRRY
ncbi:RNA-directed DNA polymerase, eukaryota [Tanacetum coccineum]